jgi:hypothetical protein
MGKKAAGSTLKDRTVASGSEQLDFTGLVEAIRQVHLHCASQARRAVNIHLTLRNWLIGGYIHHYELNGRDRAEYGEGLFSTLAERLCSLDIPNCNKRRLYRYRDFFRFYPQIVATLSPQFQNLVNIGPIEPDLQKVAAVTPLSGQEILESFSYSHIELLLEIDDPSNGHSTNRVHPGQLDGAVAQAADRDSLFRTLGLSKDREKLAAMVKRNVETADRILRSATLMFSSFWSASQGRRGGIGPGSRPGRSPPRFPARNGHGFCLEAQQKSIAIGNTRGFVDLVFYHRILKSPVLVDLKVDDFRHEHIGQLNTYVTWYRKHMMTGGDNPPVGLLLCTQKDHALVEYALAAIDNRLFVSRYQLELPSEEALQRFLEDKRRELGGEE